MYDPKTEEKWNDYWEKSDIFLFDDKDDKKPLYVIDTPPPNTTGDLHMGQAFWVSYIDAIARYKHMKGYNVLYPQGWDTQGFPVELQVEKKFGKEMPRDEFYKKCTEFATANLASMKAQMRLLGASFDERLEYITMSSSYRSKIQLSLLLMYEKHMLYRAEHPVEWCPHCNSSIAREELTDVTEDTQLNYIEFAIKSKDHPAILIATTRPELLHACVAIAVNPDDERYSKLVGKEADVPIFGSHVKIISDASVDKEFGTGAEMVCTFGDKDDITMFYKHKLNMINSIDQNGLLKNAGKFSGLGIKEARAAILEELSSKNVLKKQEKITHSVKLHDKCSTKIELISSMQWFVKSKEYAERIKEQAKQIKWNPEFAIQRLYDWADYIEWDWNISRNRVFGTPIPFWYCNSCGEIVPPEKNHLPVNPAMEIPPTDTCPKCKSHDIIGEQATCDVWVDSSITPLIIAGWPDNKELLKRAFPASLRMQGSDIIRTWAFYTILRTWALDGNKPFENMIINGMVLDASGKEMHKSEGNGVYLMDLINKYSIDSVRLWVALSGGAGKDKPFSYEELDFAKSFIIKIYNSSLFIKNAIADAKPVTAEPHDSFNVFDIWIMNRLNSVISEVDKSYAETDLYSAMGVAVNFFWHEFCDYYIENVKHRIYSKEKGMQKSRDAAIYTLMHVLSSSLRLLAPVIPHVSEEINSFFKSTSIFQEEFPKSVKQESKADYVINGLIFKSALVDVDYESAGNMLNKVISDIRKEKAQHRIALNKPIKRININVPAEYYNAVKVALGDIKEICKAEQVEEKSSDNYSVSIEV